MIADEETALVALQLKMAAAASIGKGHEIPPLQQKAKEHQATIDAGFSVMRIVLRAAVAEFFALSVEFTVEDL